MRNLSAAVYAFILLVIGIPLWWRMTEVQRHPLPYTQISLLGNMEIAIATNIFVYTKNPSETERIINEIHTTFNSSNSLDINKMYMVNLTKTYLQLCSISMLNILLS